MPEHCACIEAINRDGGDLYCLISSDSAESVESCGES